LKKITNDYINSLIASIKDAADEAVESDIHLANQLHRIAHNVAVAFLDNDLLIDNLNVDGDTKKHVASIIKEAVSSKKVKKKC